MTTGVEEQYEVSLGRAEHAEAPVQLQRNVFARLAHYGGLLRRSMHLRYRLANLISSLLPGIASGEGAVVAAGAIVLKDVPPHTYVEGNPAQVIRKLPWAYR